MITTYKAETPHYKILNIYPDTSILSFYLKTIQCKYNINDIINIENILASVIDISGPINQRLAYLGTISP